MEKKWFTLVELIVVITVLVVLAIIWFLNFWDYPAQSRDSKRLSDLWSIEQALVLKNLERWWYPEPDRDWVTLVEFDWIEWIYWKKWKFWEKQYNDLKILNTLPFDPKLKTMYDYYLSENNKFFRLECDSEITWEKIVKTNYKDWDNAWILEEKKYILENTVTFKEVNKKLWEVEKYYIDSSTRLKWDEWSSRTLKWSLNKDFSEPIWNWEDYIFLGKRKISDYPAFKHCRDKGSKWRLPTKNELINIISYEEKNKNNALTRHPKIIENRYWTSTKYDFLESSSWFVWFNNWIINTNNIVSSRMVVCVHD